jgi:hypothetical protein
MSAVMVSEGNRLTNNQTLDDLVRSFASLRMTA